MERQPEHIFDLIQRPLSLKTKLNVRLVSQRCKWLVEQTLQLSLCVFSHSNKTRLPLHACIRLASSSSNAEEEIYETFAFLTSADNLPSDRFDFSYIGASSHDRLSHHEQLGKRKPLNDLIAFLQNDETKIQNFIRIINVNLRKQSLHTQVLSTIENALCSGNRKLRLCCSALPSVCCTQATDSSEHAAQDFSTPLAYKHPSFHLAGLCVLSPPAAEDADETTELQEYARWMLLNQVHLEELSCSPIWLRTLLQDEEFSAHPHRSWKTSLQRLALTYDQGTAVDEEFLSALADHFPNLCETTIATNWRQDNAKELVFPLHTLASLSMLQKLSITSGEAKITVPDLQDGIRFCKQRVLCITDVQLPIFDPTFFARLPVLADLTVLVSNPFGRQNHYIIVKNLQSGSFRSLQNLTWGTGPGYASDSALLETCNAARQCATLSKLAIQRGDCLRQLHRFFRECGHSEGLKTPSLLLIPVKLANAAVSASLAKEAFWGQNHIGLRKLQLRCLYAYPKYQSKRQVCKGMEELVQEISGGHYEREGIALVEYSRRSKEINAAAIGEDEIASITLRWKKLSMSSRYQSPAVYSLELSF